jgi:hypothetical protein
MGQWGFPFVIQLATGRNGGIEQLKIDAQPPFASVVGSTPAVPANYVRHNDIVQIALFVPKDYFHP